MAVNNIYLLTLLKTFSQCYLHFQNEFSQYSLPPVVVGDITPNGINKHLLSNMWLQFQAQGHFIIKHSAYMTEKLQITDPLFS